MKALQFPHLREVPCSQTPGRAVPVLFYKGPLATVKFVDIPNPPCRAGLGEAPDADVRVLRLRSELIFLKDSPTARLYLFPCVSG